MVGKQLYAVSKHTCVVARKTIKSLKESTFITIKKVMKEWGLKEDENFCINNIEGTITFWNESVIMMKEMADLPADLDFSRFGSMEATIVFVDEASEISERAQMLCSPVFVGKHRRHSRHPRCSCLVTRRHVGCVRGSCKMRKGTP